MAVVKGRRHAFRVFPNPTTLRKYNSALRKAISWTPINTAKFATLKLKRQSSKVVSARRRSHAMATRAVTTRNARNAVLDTNELFEKILLQLPIVDLVNLRRVNWSWWTVIMQSNKIQQKMFLHALAAAPKKTAFDKIAPKTALDKIAPDWLFDKTTHFLRPYGPSDKAVEEGNLPNEVKQAWRENQCRMRPATLNPMLLHQDPEPQRPSLHSRAALCEFIRFSFPASTTKLSRPNIYHSMFLTNPPTYAVHLHINYRRKAQGRQRFPLVRFTQPLIVERPGGVRFGDVLATFREKAMRVDPQFDPDAEYKIEVEPLKGGQQTTVWLLGAIFVSESEFEGVMRNAEVEDLSPLAKEMVQSRGLGVDDERWFTKADAEWVEKQEIKRFGRLAPL